MAASNVLSDQQIAMMLEPNFCSLATIMPDGSPQSSVLWIDHRDGLIWLNTARHRLKTTNIERDPRVALSVWDRDDDYASFDVRGVVVEVTTDGADEHNRWLHHKYQGNFDVRVVPGNVRVICKIEPRRVFERAVR